MPTTTSMADAARWVGAFLQTADSFYPTGTYAHSFGLEGLLEAGTVTDLAALRTFLLDHALPPLADTDLPLARLAWEAADTPIDWPRLHHLSHLGAAMRGTAEVRRACLAIGSQRADLASRLHGGLAAEFNRRATAENWPRPSAIVAAIEGRTLGAPLEATLAGIVYAAAAAFASAAVKLLRLGQNAVHTLLADALACAPALIARAAQKRIEDLGTFNPWWDIASARHETANFRLFIS
ncbi:MAG: urease accessory protein UreF [Verrucomicrobia bacterium]|nr:MAG: urease accessory protein UreF [Verrucomicrobiota bacterium]